MNLRHGVMLAACAALALGAAVNTTCPSASSDSDGQCNEFTGVSFLNSHLNGVRANLEDELEQGLDMHKEVADDVSSLPGASLLAIGKPLRGFHGGRRRRFSKKKLATIWKTPWRNGTKKATLSCGTSVFAPGRHLCPKGCLYSVPDPAKVCHFKCVAKTACGKGDYAKLPVGDVYNKVCRKPQAEGCAKFVPGKDTCAECTMAYRLVKGECLTKTGVIWPVVYCIVGVIAIVVLIWYCSLLCRPSINSEVLAKGMRHRARASLRRPDEGHAWYPLATDLTNCPSDGPPVGGAGLMMHMNFQCTVMLWCLIGYGGWYLLSLYGGEEMLVLGTVDPADDQEMCAAVKWGRKTRDSIYALKFGFTLAFWFLSTLGCIVYGACQMRKFQRADNQTDSMSDFAVKCTGFPSERGATVEKDVSEFLERATGFKPVGISVCWDFVEKRDEVFHLARHMVYRQERGMDEDGGSSPSNQGVDHSVSGYMAPAVAPISSYFHRAEEALGLECEQEEDGVASFEADQQMAREVFENIEASGMLFAVFSTEDARDQAMDALSQADAPKYKGEHVISATNVKIEPQSFFWENIGVSPELRYSRLLKGVGFMVFAVIIWAVCFFGPHAYFEASAYAAGKEPGFASAMSFNMIVVAGNLTMYFICATIAEGIEFETKEESQATYVVLYAFAVIVNTIVDLSIVVIQAYYFMVSEGVRTADGILLKDLPDAGAVFDSYPMQKFFGAKLFEYNFPSCFLLPFILEVLFTIVIPLHLAKLIVRTRNCSLRQAESYLVPMPMDLGRYGDILINVTLTASAFFTSSGWIPKTLICLLGSNVYIYMLDQYRTLRQVETFNFATGTIDLVAQRLMFIPCGILLSAAAFQARTLNYLGMQAMSNSTVIIVAFLISLVIQWLGVRFLLPFLGNLGAEHAQAETDYATAAAKLPDNWFNTNPVHCIRSLFLHKQQPPCMYVLPGKDSCIQANPVIGLHYVPSKYIDHATATKSEADVSGGK